MDTRSSTAESLTDTHEETSSIFPWEKVRDTVGGRAGLLREANKLAQADGSPEAQELASELTDEIIALVRKKKPEERDAMLADIRRIVSPLGLDVGAANTYEGSAAPRAEATAEESVDAPLVSAIAAEPRAPDERMSAPVEGATRPVPQFDQPASAAETPTMEAETQQVPAVETVSAQPSASGESAVETDQGSSLEEMQQEVTSIRESFGSQLQHALVTNPDYVRALTEWDTSHASGNAPLEKMRDTYRRLKEAAAKFSAEAPRTGAEEPVRWGTPAETPPDEPVVPSAEISPRHGASAPLVGVPSYEPQPAEQPVSASDQSTSAAEADAQESFAAARVETASPVAQPPAAERDVDQSELPANLGSMPQDTFRESLSPRSTPEARQAVQLSRDMYRAHIPPEDLQMPQEIPALQTEAAPSAVPAETAASPIESIAEESAVEQMPAAVQAPTNDIDAPLEQAPTEAAALANGPELSETGETVDEEILMDPEVSGGLAELMDGWPGFDKSGLLGFGPHGIKHPMYIKLANRRMEEILGQSEGVEQAA